MDQLTLYNQILDLQPPWTTVDVSLDKTAGQLIVKVECKSRCCPKCGKECPVYDHRLRRWRHLDTCQYMTIIESNLPRVECPVHGCITIPAPWAEDKSRYTALFENEVITRLFDSPISAVSKQFKISWNAVDGIMRRGLSRGKSRYRSRIYCKHLSVDETKIGPNRDFITILSNRLGQVLAISDGRSASSLIECFKSIPIQFLNKVTTISMDMSQAYQSAVRTYFGRRADKLIAFDHFHITKMLNETLNKVRQKEASKLPKLKNLDYHKTRYTWMRNQDNLCDEENTQLQNLRSRLSNTAVVWFYKERLREIWKAKSQPEAKTLWRIWINQALKSNILSLTKIAQTIRSSLRGILNAMKYRVSNGRAEAINQRIKYLGRRANGFRNRERYKQVVMFYFGKLDMKLDPP